MLAAIAVVISLVVLLSHVHDSGAATAWVLLLPVIFIGIPELCVLPARLSWVVTAWVPAPPVLPASFQRPPPFRLA
jgi:hypothetical protein